MMKRLFALLALLLLAGCEDLDLEMSPPDQLGDNPPLSAPPLEATQPAPAEAIPEEGPPPEETAMVTPPPAGDRSCADFLFYRDAQPGVPSVIADPLTITATPDGADQMLEFHDPAQDMGVQGALSVRIADKIYITADEPYTRFEVSYISGGEDPIKLTTYGNDGELQQLHILAAYPPRQLLVQPISAAKGIRTMVLVDESRMGLLAKVCTVR